MWCDSWLEFDIEFSGFCCGVCLRVHPATQDGLVTKSVFFPERHSNKFGNFVEGLQKTSQFVRYLIWVIVEDTPETHHVA